MGTCASHRAPEDPAGGDGVLVRSQGRRRTASEGRVCLSHDRDCDVVDNYEMNCKELGQGGFGTVCLARHKNSGATRAIKSVDKWQSNDLEKALMQELDHPNLIKLFEVYEGRTSTNFVMEYCSGGDLFDRILEAKRCTEPQAAIVFQQILDAIVYLHGINIVHRDLKPENLLFLTDGPVEGNTIKVIDFGTACRCTPGDVLVTQVGSPYYIAPQVLCGAYDQRCDVWSLGVILHVLLSGYPPFKGQTCQETIGLIRRGLVEFRHRCWEHVSQDAKSLIKAMLQVCPDRRISADQALRREWISQSAPRACSGQLDDGTIERLRGFQEENMLRHVALHVAAGQLAPARLKSLKDAFKKLDVDGDGKLSLSDLEAGLKSIGGLGKPGELRAMLANVDSDSSGTIDYTEFLAATLDTRRDLDESDWWVVFNVFDRDGNGKISTRELLLALPWCAKKQVSHMVKEVDSDGDGEIGFEDFVAMMHGVSGHCGEAC